MNDRPSREAQSSSVVAGDELDSVPCPVEPSETVQTPPPLLEPKPREFLLSEARDRYKSEQERHNQVFTRASIYLGVLVLYLNVLGRFLDKPLPNGHGFTHHMFWWSIVAFLIVTAWTAVCIVAAIQIRDFAFIHEPGGWIAYIADELRPYLSKWKPDADPNDSISDELQQQVLERYSKAIDDNIKINLSCRMWLFRASVGLLLGLIPLIVAATSYGVLSAGATPQADTIRVRVVDQVDIREHNRTNGTP